MSKSVKTWPEMVEGMRLAFDAVRVNKFRSIMTIIGVMIGVGAVILVNTIMDGFTQYTYESIDKIGRNVMYVSQWTGHEDWDNLTEEERRRKPITMDEAYAIREMCPLVGAIAPQKSARNNILKYEEKEIRTPDDFRGTWPEWVDVMAREIEHGRSFDDNDMAREAMVVVIGPEIADALFDTRADAVGKDIRINGYRFQVIGVMEHIEDFFNISENDFAFIPMSTFERLYPNEKEVELLVSAVSREVFDEALDQVVNAVRRVRKLRPEDENNFGVETQARFKDQVGDIVVKVQLGATGVACVGLLVGVIGVMNIMLIAVTQRTREIGVRKAVGARRANIMFQFLVEAGTLTGMGGIIGIVVGALVGLLVTSLLDWHYSLSLLWTFIGLAMSAGTGMIAGLYPAWRAARVNPIEALRYE
ncbi:MAG TPA: ABC transporter permease [bacterium]|nr:ABC transporter permease [bacterium]